MCVCVRSGTRSVIRQWRKEIQAAMIKCARKTGRRVGYQEEKEHRKANEKQANEYKIPKTRNWLVSCARTSPPSLLIRGAWANQSEEVSEVVTFVGERMLAAAYEN